MSWVRSIGMGCPTCGSVDIEFEYRHLYMMGDPKPVAREGTCTCKKCGHRFPHTQWREPKAPVVEPAKPEQTVGLGYSSSAQACLFNPKKDEDPFWASSAGKKIGLPMTVWFNMDEWDELEKLLGVKRAEELLPKIRQMVHEYDSKAGLNALVATQMGAVETRKRLGQILKEEPDLLRRYASTVANVLLKEIRHGTIRIEAHRDRVAAKILNKLFNLE